MNECLFSFTKPDPIDLPVSEWLMHAAMPVAVEEQALRGTRRRGAAAHKIRRRMIKNRRTAPLDRLVEARIETGLAPEERSVLKDNGEWVEIEEDVLNGVLYAFELWEQEAIQGVIPKGFKAGGMKLDPAKRRQKSRDATIKEYEEWLKD